MKILWAIKKGAESWEEQLITEDETKIEAAKKWAIANGFDRFRVSEYQAGEKPDFRKVII